MAAPDPWPSADPLGEALHFLRMRGAFYCRSEFTAPWGLTLPAFDGYLWLHAVVSGHCLFETEDGAHEARAGDLVLVPHGAGHALRSEPEADAPSVYELEAEPYGERYEILRHGGGGERCDMVCCAVAFDHPAARNVIDALPPLIRVDALGRSSRSEWIQSTLRLMAAEAGSVQPGGEAIVTRLADVLVVQAIRAWIEEDDTRTGWLGALRDPQIGRAILAVQRDPARDWSVESLAHGVAMSRSAFAERFRSLLGETPMRYVTRWRMSLALTVLEQEDVSLAQLAGRLGYQSEAAFSRAFKRSVGVSPGEARRRARAREESFASG